MFLTNSTLGFKHWTVVEKKRITGGLPTELSSIDDFTYVPITKIDGSKDYYQYNDLLYQYTYGNMHTEEDLFTLILKMK